MPKIALQSSQKSTLGQKSKRYEKKGVKTIKLSGVLEINAENSLTNEPNKFINRVKVIFDEKGIKTSRLIARE